MNIKTQHLPKICCRSRKSLQAYTEIVTKDIFEWHKGLHDRSPAYLLSDSIEAAGYALLEMLIHRQNRYIAMKQKVVRSKEIYLHCEVMKKSFQEALLAGGTRTEQAKNALKIAVSIKKSIFNIAPRLVLVHDIDKNLTVDDSYYTDFPNYNLFVKAKEIHDKYMISPWESRFPALSVVGVLNSTTRDIFLSLLKELGRKISNLVFEDVKELLYHSSYFVNQGTIECCIVTANNSIVARELSSQLGWLPEKIWGVDERNCDGFDKALTLLEILCDNPNTIIVLSDDGDSSLIEGLEKDSLLDSISIPVPLSYLCFFAARCATAEETDEYKLYEALNAKKLPFLINWADHSLSERVYGYQGVSRYVETYKESILENKSYRID